MTPQRIPDDVLRRHPDATRAPAPSTDVELAALLDRLPGAGSIAIGHGRHPSSVATAAALTGRWTRAGGEVVEIVDWPARAASWLRPARRLAAARPDRWVLVDTAAGVAQVVVRLAGQPGWDADRTLLTASARVPDLAVLLAGVPGALTGVAADGGSWRVGRGLLVTAARLA